MLSKSDLSAGLRRAQKLALKARARAASSPTGSEALRQAREQQAIWARKGKALRAELGERFKKGR